MKHYLHLILFFSICLLLSSTPIFSQCCPNIVPNGSFENYPNTFTFPLDFNGNTAELAAQGDNIANSWTTSTADTGNPTWLINDVSDNVNNTDGNYFAYIKGQYDCLEVDGFICEEGPLEQDITYELCFDAASWNQNFSGTTPTTPGTQADTEVIVDISHNNGSNSQTAPTTITASSTWNTLNWQRICYDLLFTTNGTRIVGLQISQEGSGGFALDNVVFKRKEQADAGNDAMISCTSGTFTTSYVLSASPAVGTWSQDITNPNGATLADATDANTTISGLTNGTYKFIWSAAACSDTLTLEITCDIPTYDVSLEKTVNLTQVAVDTEVIFTIWVFNNGVDVTNAVVTDVLPNGSLYVSDDSAGNYDENSGIWTIGNIAAGDSTSLNLTIRLTEEGVHTNLASVSIDETETDLTNNEDDACVSVPMTLPCNNAGITAEAETGHTSYQWYKDGVAIDGETSATYLITTIGSYNYTIDGDILNDDCANQMCCPIITIEGNCSLCPPQKCTSITITKN